MGMVPMEPFGVRPVANISNFPEQVSQEHHRNQSHRVLTIAISSHMRNSGACVLYYHARQRPKGIRMDQVA